MLGVAAVFVGLEPQPESCGLAPSVGHCANCTCWVGSEMGEIQDRIHLQSGDCRDGSHPYLGAWCCPWGEHYLGSVTAG